MLAHARFPGSRLRRLAGALPRPQSGILGITLMVAAFMAIFLNKALWKAVIAAADIGMARNLGFGLSLAAALFAFFVMLLSLIGIRYLFKPVVVALLLVASLASYVMNVYGVVIDDTMILNVLETDCGDASGLLRTRLLLHLLLTGLLPALVVCIWRIRYHTFWRETGLRLVAFAAATAVLGAAVHAHYKDFSMVLREHRELRYLVNPTYPLYAAARAFIQTVESADTPIVPLGEEARQQPPVNAQRRAVMFVVDETTRDAHPRLEVRNIVNFAHSTSCGASTSVSVPCKVSPLDRESGD